MQKVVRIDVELLYRHSSIYQWICAHDGFLIEIKHTREAIVHFGWDDGHNRNQ